MEDKQSTALSLQAQYNNQVQQLAETSITSLSNSYSPKIVEEITKECEINIVPLLEYAQEQVNNNLSLSKHDLTILIYERLYQTCTKKYFKKIILSLLNKEKQTQKER